MQRDQIRAALYQLLKQQQVIGQGQARKVYLQEFRVALAVGRAVKDGVGIVGNMFFGTDCVHQIAAPIGNERDNWVLIFRRSRACTAG